MDATRTILVTTGDQDGIGYEVTAKALSKLKVPGVRFVIFRSPSAEKKYQKIVARLKHVEEIVSSKSPALWVEDAAQLCLTKHAAALVTAPLSKTLIRQSGLRAIGHTEILKSVTKTSHVFMGFVGKYFNVVLATGHLPVSGVAAAINPTTVERACLAAYNLKTSLLKKSDRRPIAVLGLNPHAGESGLIGSEDQNIIASTVRKLSENDLGLVGPLVPDAAFFKQNWKKYSAFVAMYHDQGLIPFKMIHEQYSGAQISLGLPFIRTSVDHGTAKDIFGKGRAIPNSMSDALKLAIQMSRGD